MKYLLIVCLLAGCGDVAAPLEVAAPRGHGVVGYAYCQDNCPDMEGRDGGLDR